MVDYPSVLSNKNKNLPSHIKILDKILFFIYNNSIADIAQLAERSTRNAEVASSILAVGSIQKQKGNSLSAFVYSSMQRRTSDLSIYTLGLPQVEYLWEKGAIER